VPRSSWDQLSATYRSRLERGGVSKSDYDSGRSLGAARGHAKTPERPERADNAPGKYQEYRQKRNTLIAQVAAKKQAAFGTNHKFRGARSRANVAVNPVTKKAVPIADLVIALNADEYDWQDMIADDSERWAFLYYH
jgi:hypothetical protein